MVNSVEKHSFIRSSKFQVSGSRFQVFSPAKQRKIRYYFPQNNMTKQMPSLLFTNVTELFPVSFIGGL